MHVEVIMQTPKWKNVKLESLPSGTVFRLPLSDSPERVYVVPYAIERGPTPLCVCITHLGDARNLSPRCIVERVELRSLTLSLIDS